MQIDHRVGRHSGDGGNANRIAVGRTTRRFRSADRPARAAAVFGDDRVAQEAAQWVCDDARDHVGGAADGERHDQPDRPGRPARGLGTARQRQQSDHDCPGGGKKGTSSGR